MLLLMNEFLDFKKEIQVKEFSAKRICDSRWIKHWIIMGLLFEDPGTEENKWTKFSFVELIWLKTILKMRQFGLSLDDIKSVKNYIAKFNVDNQNTIKGFTDILSFAIMRMEMEFVITKSDNNDVQIMLNDPKDRKNPFQSFISISINGLIKDFIMDFESDSNEERCLKNILRFNLLTHPELEIFDLLRRGLISEVQIINEKDTITYNFKDLNDYLEIVLQSKYTSIKYTYNNVEQSFNRHNKEK